MAGSLGSLVVSLGLDAAQFTSGLTKAEYEAQKSAQAILGRLQAITSGAAAIARGLGIAFGIQQVVQWGEHVVEDAEKLGRLRAETGSSIEQLSKLQNIVEVSGGSFEDFKIILDRFAAGLAGTDEHGSRVSEVMKLLAVSARDPAEAMIETAKRLNEFADGANKAALARDAFGRGGVAFLQQVKAIGDASDITATKTQEQVEAATKLAESYRLLKIQSHELSDAFLNNVVPVLTRVITQFNEARKAGAGYYDMIRAALTAGSVFDSPVEALVKIDKEIASIQSKIATAEKGGVNAFVGRLLGTVPSATDLRDQLGQLQRDRQLVEARRLAALKGTTAEGVKPQAPLLPPIGEADQIAKRLLDAQLAELKSASDREKALLELRNEVVSAEYDQGLISLKQFGDAKKAALLEDLQNVEKNYHDELRFIQARIDTPGIKESDRLDAIKLRTEATDRFTLRAIAGAREFVKSENDQTNATREFSNQIKELNAQVLELSGNTAEATRIRLQFQGEPLRKALAASGETEALRAQAAIERQRVAQAALVDQTIKYQAVIESLGIAQSRLDLEAQTGSLSEIELLTKKADLARLYVPQLTAQYEIQKKIVDANIASGALFGPAAIDALARLAQMKLGIDQLAQATDGLKIKFDGIFTDNLTTFFDDITSHTKSLSRAFRDMGASIERTFLHLINEELAKQLYRSLFGAGGVTGGTSLGGLLANLLSSAFGTGTAGAGAGASAGWPTGAGGIPEFASGTDFAPGGWAKVHRDEIINLPRGAQVIPNSELMSRRNQRGGTTLVINQTIMPGVTRQTSAQAAGNAARAFEQYQRNS